MHLQGRGEVRHICAVPGIPPAPLPHKILPCLSVLTPSAPEMRLISPILYMWSAMLSGPFTLHLIHPVLFDVYKQA